MKTEVYPPLYLESLQDSRWSAIENLLSLSLALCLFAGMIICGISATPVALSAPDSIASATPAPATADKRVL